MYKDKYRDKYLNILYTYKYGITRTIYSKS